MFYFFYKIIFRRKKEKDNISAKLEENSKYPKILWKTIKSLGLPSKKVKNKKICLKDQNEIIFDSSKTAEKFKDFLQV